MKPTPTNGICRVFRAANYSLKGLAAAWRCEQAFRQEAVLVALLLPVALFVEVTAVERILLAGSLLLVLIVELLNSAVEAVVDRIGSERHALSAQAKDMGSAAVMLALLLAAFAWVSILIF